MYLILLVTLLVSYLAAPFVITCARRLSLLDVANERSSHDGIALRGGGILFIVVFYLSIGVEFSLGKMELLPFFSTLLMGAMIMTLIGLADDFKGLSVVIRFVVQISLVLFALNQLPPIWPWIPVVFEKMLLLGAWVWFINLFNFMDGADGFAAQESLFICIALIILHSADIHYLGILAVALMGFLRVNYPKAKIFMGDSGSLFLGYFLGGYLIHSLSVHHITLLQAFAITSLFSFDATYTLLKRIGQKKKVWQAHREHWYQRLLNTGLSHQQLFWTGIIYNLTVLLTLFGTVDSNPVYLLVSILFIWLIYVKAILKREKSG